MRILTRLYVCDTLIPRLPGNFKPLLFLQIADRVRVSVSCSETRKRGHDPRDVNAAWVAGVLNLDAQPTQNLKK